MPVFLIFFFRREIQISKKSHENIATFFERVGFTKVKRKLKFVIRQGRIRRKNVFPLSPDLSQVQNSGKVQIGCISQ